ncbi:hypothetical protein GE09DRAFT_644435 [Coniochaeta sp. 2T2.1]|nr:hypothetical protein GE09DRAFT_644435 [Coniochaeta sp. 2T2.1]
MPSPQHTIASVSNTGPLPAASALSSTPPQASSIFAATSFTSPSPKSVAPKAHQPNHSASAANSRQYHYGSVSYNRSAPETAYYQTQHITSAIAEPHPSDSAATYLPRTSSLLGPPNVASDHPSGFRSTPPIFQNPFNAQPINSLKDLEFRPPRRPSRSSSAGGLSDSFRNLNRWSASTTSSRASPVPGHRKNTSASSRRVSVDVAGSIYTSPRKLQKHRQPSQASDASRSPNATRPRQESISVVPPLQSLPHIATLPSLEQELQGISPASAHSGAPRQEYAEDASDNISAVYWDGPTATPKDTTGLSARIGGIEGKERTERRLPGEMMPYAQNGEPRGHSRSRSTGAKGSTDTTSSRGKERDRSNKQPSQKAMLSKALQKANMAVQLDNAQNPEGAREAYAEACELLQQVLQRTAGEEDRKKLEAIVSCSGALNTDPIDTDLSFYFTQRKTYTSRIEELDTLLALSSQDGKALPRRPSSSLDRPDSMIPAVSDDEEFTVETATVMRNAREQGELRGAPAGALPSYSVPIPTARRQYNGKTPQLSIETSRDDASYYLTGQYPLQSSFSKSPRLNPPPGLQPPMDSQYMPPPLSPRRPLSPVKAPEREPEPPQRTDLSAYANRLAPAAGARGHQRGNSHESVSWLDPIEESGGSAASSVHSRSSSRIRRKHIRAPSGETEAEFDAALDDAIEAAYNDGYEPDDSVDQENDMYQEESTEDAVAKALRRVEIARERVRETEREALILANEREKRLRLQQQEEEEEMMREQQELQRDDSLTEDFYDGADSEEEEERILEEMTRGYAIEEFALNQQKRPSIPRQSDSSGLTSRTWHSSMGSNPPTATTILTTVSESTVTSAYTKPPSQPVPAVPAPAPTQALPQLPPQPLSAGSQSSANSQGVRSRRLSGQNAKQLKIETSKPAPPPAPTTAGPTQTASKAGGYIVQQRQALSAGAAKLNGPFSARQAPSPAPGAVTGDATPPPPSALHQEAEGRAGSPAAARPALRKNFSSSSLRSMKSRNISVSNIDDASDLSPGTPLTNPYGLGGSHTRLPAMPSLPTPIAVAFKDRINNASTGGLYLFDVDIHSPRDPGSPNPLVTDAPLPLEPCPQDVMLRPFWLMRCLYQTLCHPRGGYISNKLFVPRDVWRVKGVKLKNVEDKIASCDYLTAALQKLAQVDSTDADAVLEEMQTLEGVLETVQASLTRKLGSEVGVSGATALFRDATDSSNTDGQTSSVPRSASVSHKSGGGFWARRLRTKTSSANMGGNAYPKSAGGGGGGTTPTEGGARDTTVASLPMTSHPTSRPAKRDVGSVQFGGPNANYMSALARLCDAAQTVDQIARQVADPGLRHADKTQVGLELCTRQAAEFFGFYVCRFVLGDLTMLLDKFIKRGSEWVLA